MPDVTRPPGRQPPAPPEPPGEETTGLCPRDPSPAELGHRIKTLRIARGLTLKDLELRGGISATHISEIERGRASPTVGALGRIARALGMQPATLVEPHVLPEVSLMRAAERATHRVRLGTATAEPVTGPMLGAVLGAQLLVLPAGRAPAFSHQHEGEEWATVLAGAAEVRVDGEPYLLREGDSIHFRAHREHSYANRSSVAATLLVADRPRPSL
jgi:transcriptional regulator with XRE-family HTH domain